MRLLPLPHFDVAIADFVAVVLQQDAAVRPLAETRPHLVLAVGDQRAEHLAVAIELDDFLVVQPVLDTAVVRDDASLVPLPNALELLRAAFSLQVFGRDQVVERTQCPVAVDTRLGIRVYLVVQNLEFAADGGTRSVGRRNLGLR